MMFNHVDNIVFKIITRVALEFFATIATILIFFLTYWLLPNAKVKARAVAPAAIVIGLLLEGLRFIYMRCLPLLDFQESYGPFFISVTLIFWAYIGGLLLLGGAFLSAAEKANNHHST